VAIASAAKPGAAVATVKPSQRCRQALVMTRLGLLIVLVLAHVNGYP